MDGDSVEAALDYAKEATTAYPESLIRHGEPVPSGVIAATQRRPSLFGRGRTLRRFEANRGSASSLLHLINLRRSTSSSLRGRLDTQNQDLTPEALFTHLPTLDSND